MSDTPRTDDAYKNHPWDMCELIPADFARKLERELAAMTKERDELLERMQNNPWCAACNEPDCCVRGDGTCAMIRKYLKAEGGSNE